MSVGPCFVCSKETVYGLDRYRFTWPVEKRRKEQLIESLKLGYFRSQRRERTLRSIFDSALCLKCRTDIEQGWRDTVLARQREQAEREAQRERAGWLRTWRTPADGEFASETGLRRFVADCFDGRKTNLLFRWRTMPAMECRGDSPARRVGFWVDGRLTAHYYGWDLPEIPNEDGPTEDAVDVYGPGLAFWIERNFQDALCRQAPDAVWEAYSRRPIGRRDHSLWDGAEYFCEPLYAGYAPPCLVHSEALDGSRYARLCHFFTVDDVVEFAWEKLGIDVRDCD